LSKNKRAGGSSVLAILRGTFLNEGCSAHFTESAVGGRRVAEDISLKSHQLSSEIVRQLCSNEFSMDFKRDLLLLRAHPELISYIAPLSGDSNATGLDADHWIDMLTLLC
jgi:hypothetical protein